MGNRAVITTKDRKIGLYLHWNGGRDTVEPLLRYCELKGYRAPSQDDYGWARICQVLGNFFGGTHCVGIGAYTDDERMNPGDNGIYVIDGWEITGRIYPYEHFEEQREYPFDEMLRAFDPSRLFFCPRPWQPKPPRPHSESSRRLPGEVTSWESAASGGNARQMPMASSPEAHRLRRFPPDSSLPGNCQPARTRIGEHFDISARRGTVPAIWAVLACGRKLPPVRTCSSAC